MLLFIIDQISLSPAQAKSLYGGVRWGSGPVLHFQIVPGHSGKNANVPAIIFAWGGADSIKIVIVYHSKLLNSH